MLTPPITPYLLEDFPSVISARPITARDARGKATAWGSAINLPARIEGGPGRQFSKDGGIVTAKYLADICGYFALSVDWEYTLPAPFKPTIPEPLHVDTESDENGYHHQTVYFL